MMDLLALPDRTGVRKAVLRCLAWEDVGTAQMGGWRLAALDPDVECPRFRAMLRSDKPLERVAAIAGLYACKDACAVPSLRAVLGDETNWAELSPHRYHIRGPRDQCVPVGPCMTPEEPETIGKYAADVIDDLTGRELRGNAAAIDAWIGANLPPADASPSARSANAGLGRFVAIGDLDGIARAAGRGTALLPRRSADAAVDLPDGVRIVTHCGATWCVDGLTVGDKTLIPAVLDAEEAETYGADGAMLERVIRVAWSDETHVSIYVAESAYSGGVHADNSLACRSFDVATGRLLGLGDVLPAASVELLGKRIAPLLDDPDAAIEALGAPIEASGFALTNDGFRFGTATARGAPGTAIILCAEGPDSDSSRVLEIPLDNLPAGYLLR